MASTILLKALGLNTSPNTLDSPEGGMSEASNVIIRRDNVVEPRRGFKLYGNEFGTSTDRAKQLFSYRDRILRHYSDKIQFDNGSGTFTDFSGTFSEVDAGLRIKSSPSNGNFYFTSSEGIKKISAASGSELSSSSGYITQAGGAKAIDATGRVKRVLGDTSSFLTTDSGVAYRVVWAEKDANINLILGSPSQRTEVINSLLETLTGDFNNVLGALDDIAEYATVDTNAAGYLIDNKNYVNTLKLLKTSSADELRSFLIALASKIDNDIYLANDTATNAPLNTDGAASTIGAANLVTIVFSAGNPSQYISSGDKIILSGFTLSSAPETINSIQTVLTVSATAITFTNPTTLTVASTITVVGDIKSYNYRNITQPVTLSPTPTNDQLVSLQTYLNNIISRLQFELFGVISTSNINGFIDILDTTASATVILDITIPSEVTSNHFLQIYRSRVAVITGVSTLSDLAISDELQLAYEAYPTAAELTARLMIVEDIITDDFLGANLYTNSISGEGIDEANEPPPFAKDITNFKSYQFFANTRRKHNKIITLLGVSDMLLSSSVPKLTISDGSIANTYSFVRGINEITDDVTIGSAGATLNGKYFTLNSANNINKYAVVYNTGITSITAAGGPPTYTVTVTTANPHNLTTGDSVTIVGSGTTPSVDGTFIVIVTGLSTFTYSFSSTAASITAGGATGQWNLNVPGRTSIRVDYSAADTTTVVAQKTRDSIAIFNQDFTVASNTNIVTIANLDAGYADDATSGTSGFTIGVITQGQGENSTNKEVLLSSSDSIATAIDQTARSLVRIINKNPTERVYAFYLSGPTDIPGKIYLESKNLSINPFYLLTDSVSTGGSFNPDLSPTKFITAINTVTDEITVTAHGLNNLDYIIISGSSSTPNIDGLYQITVINANIFTIGVNITAAGSFPIGIIPAILAEISENEVKENRVYYAKFQQPEAVPFLNYIDVGAADKSILRIVPLRDSLFVLKEDGLFRISGETTPFSLALFDGSCILIAADSIGSTNNFFYGWTTQGVSQISESGIRITSRPIDVDILKLQVLTNFKTATWGIGYDSDNSYLVWTVLQNIDTYATIAYRYNTLTDSWTTYDKSNTCGVVHDVDDKLYLGAADTNFIEQERKSFSRFDYADREYITSLAASDRYINGGERIKLDSVVNIRVGDVLAQEQYLAAYDFNILLKKLDIDLEVFDTNYFSSLQASGGSNLRTQLTNLATKLDADAGVIDTNYSSTTSPKSGSITVIEVGSPTVVITTSVVHGLVNNRIITITGSNSTPNIDGQYKITVVNATKFSIEATVTTAGSTGAFSTLDNDFRDIQACYNALVIKLNADIGVSFTNASTINYTTLQEAVIIAINKVTKEITLDIKLPYVIGTMTTYERIESSIKYLPNIMGDPLGLKHLREFTMLFEDKTFTNAMISFATDLLPVLIDIPFNGDGAGLYGHQNFGEGFFGGRGNSAPFRTYIPRNCMRCRFLIVKFVHAVAREKYAVLGHSVTGEVGLSTRAYK